MTTSVPSIRDVKRGKGVWWDHLSLGPLETETHCDECGRTVPSELRAYALTTPTCIRCATLEEA